MRRTAIVAVLLTVAVASLTFTAYQYVFPRPATTPSASTKCVILGQPGGIFLKVLSNSTLKPVAGVSVTAINRPALCNGSPATSQTVKTFTTNGTEWFPLPSDNNAAYSLTATYLGRTYNFTADLRPVSLTCATLSLPSGQTDVTVTEFGGACASSYSATPPSLSEVALAGPREAPVDSLEQYHPLHW